MPDKKYKTPNGKIVPESALRSQYGSRFDSLVSNGTLTEYSEQSASSVYVTPNGKKISEGELRQQYGDRFETLVANNTLVAEKKEKIGSQPSENGTTPSKTPLQLQSNGGDSNDLLSFMANPIAGLNAKVVEETIAQNKPVSTFALNNLKQSNPAAYEKVRANVIGNKEINKDIPEEDYIAYKLNDNSERVKSKEFSE